MSMIQNIDAEVIAIGTELLLGEITDTNSVHIARTLRDIGVNLYFMTSVGDNEQRIADSIRIALSRAQVVITCGGLGPTVDDMTRQAVAAATERGLTFHQDLLDKIAERFAGFRVNMTENNRRQAYLPDHAILIENPVGTAPSFIVEYDDKIVISLPGVPREMKYLLAERVVPFLRERFSLGSSVIKARVLRTAGIGESALDAAIGDQLLQASNPTVGLAAHAGQVDVRITAKADSMEVADLLIAEVESQLRERIGAYVFGTDEEQIEEVLARFLEKKQARLAISETGIGSVIAERIKTVALADRVLAINEGYHHPDDLRRTLSTEKELPIRELAERAAETICKASGALVGIAVVSYPEMDEHFADKDEGTAIAVYLGGNVRSRSYGFGGQAETAKSWASTWALSMAWRMLRETFHDD
jgi:nicotinamide-nucleotide amidase